MSNILRPIIRTFAFVRKELFEILRQTRLVLTLIIGPFLILLLFGVGYRNEPRTLRTLFVVPEGSGLADQVDEYAESLGPRIEFAGITSDADEADQRLRDQEVDMVVVTPADPIANIRNNEQAIFNLYHYEIDPYEASYVQVIARIYADELNQRVLETVADQGRDEAASVRDTLENAKRNTAALRQSLEEGDGAAARQHKEALNEDLELLTLTAGTSMALFDNVQGNVGSSETAESEADSPILASLTGIQDDLDAVGQINPDQDEYQAETETVGTIESKLDTLELTLGDFLNIDSYVLVSPFRSEVLSVAEKAVQDPTHFFVPGVIALLLQHLGVTMAALSIVREHREGAMELFRAAPVSAFETLLGKYLSYFLLSATLSAVLTALIILFLNVPMLGGWDFYALVIGALLFTSLGVGFVLSLAARTESQAVQYSMIILLASIFFSGFFLALYRLWTPVRVVSWALPATYGTQLLQSVMLRGQDPDLVVLLALFLIGIGLFVVAWVTLARVMRSE